MSSCCVYNDYTSRMSGNLRDNAVCITAYISFRHKLTQLYLHLTQDCVQRDTIHVFLLTRVAHAFLLLPVGPYACKQICS